MSKALANRSKNNASQPKEAIFACAAPLTEALLAEMEQEWGALMQRAATPNVFLEHWMVRAALPLFVDQKVMLFWVRENDKLVGLFLLEESSGYAHLPLGLVKTATHMHQFLGTPIVAKGSEHVFARGLCDWLDAQPAHIGFCQLTQFAAAGSLNIALQEICAQDNRRYDEIERFDRAVIAGIGDAADYLGAEISNKLRKQLGRKGRRLAEQGDVRLERLEDMALAPAWLECFLALENKSWKGANGTSILSNDTEADFFRAMVPVAAQRGALRFSRLMLGDQPIAYALDLSSGGHVYAHKVSYDPDYAKYSPGLLLDLEVLPAYFADPDVLLVDSCASILAPVPSALWAHRRPVLQLLIGRKGLRHELTLQFARLLEEGAATIRALSPSSSSKE